MYQIYTETKHPPSSTFCNSKNQKKKSVKYNYKGERDICVIRSRQPLLQRFLSQKQMGKKTREKSWISGEHNFQTRNNTLDLLNL